MNQTRYEELQDLTAKYGEETVRFTQAVKAAGTKILSAYSDFFGC